MNRHFTDARYYARRTADELALAVHTELDSAEERANAALGRTHHEPTRSERARALLDRVGSTARRRAD
ncbi:hypothetical protein [Halobacterium sp. R2-5]|uniref:hypothetical protein n=1 Tax=Halobacterium sp. R2-5 TaxID=2715751 RepID=UPI0014249FEA|nr:hypothetical protein [Halobacterium sp. R2-5]NIC00221.1 hypothetical protein [Halobacterium sp. R2-5]